MPDGSGIAAAHWQTRTTARLHIGYHMPETTPMMQCCVNRASMGQWLAQDCKTLIAFNDFPKGSGVHIPRGWQTGTLSYQQHQGHKVPCSVHILHYLCCIEPETEVEMYICISIIYADEVHVHFPNSQNVGQWSDSHQGYRTSMKEWPCINKSAPDFRPKFWADMGNNAKKMNIVHHLEYQLSSRVSLDTDCRTYIPESAV